MIGSVGSENDEKEWTMQLYAIFRRSGWGTPEEIGAASERSTVEREKLGGIRHIRSYVLQEENGRLGTICFYMAESPEAVREHARRADLPADEVVPVASTVVVEPDPAAAARAEA